VSTVDWQGGLPPSTPLERGDAARNRLLLLDAARRLIAERGADAVSMDDIASAAGVGKGTVFRRFGSRAGLMMVLLDEDERASQEAFLFGPPPLGPDAPPLDRLLAFGLVRITLRELRVITVTHQGLEPQVHPHFRCRLVTVAGGRDI